MTCKSCEERRQWIKQQVENAKQSWQRLINRNNQQTTRSDDSAKSDDDESDANSSNSESTVDRNSGSEQSIDESGTKSD
ncbi:hypothetical protein F975_01768 [Acinetobacter sp. ANC 3789]|nr:hypothetical protein F975_01768 [Acinetobacter sp. ANC 3789]